MTKVYFFLMILFCFVIIQGTLLTSFFFKFSLGLSVYCAVSHAGLALLFWCAIKQESK